MTVSEYLKILNGVSETDELTAENLKFGDPVIDIMPVINGVLSAGPCIWEVNSGKLIIKRYYVLQNGSKAYVERETSLEDDIALHCGSFNTPEQIIEETIKQLSIMHESNKRIENITGKPELVDYEPIIRQFNNYLEIIRKTRTK